MVAAGRPSKQVLLLLLLLLLCFAAGGALAPCVWVGGEISVTGQQGACLRAERSSLLLK